MELEMVFLVIFSAFWGFHCMLEDFFVCFTHNLDENCKFYLVTKVLP